MLSRDEILSKTDLKREVVSVPEWGGQVIVSEMSGAARDEWEQALQERDSKGRLVSPRAKLIIATLVDDAGNRLFTDKDLDKVSRLSSTTLERICRMAQKVNALLSDDLESDKKN